jgi:DNA-binding SARP family transcriptional activator/Ca2+-binding EF-hand superfamily protein
VLHIQLLGPVRAEGNAGPVPLRGMRQRTLLARLALSASSVVSQDDLVESLWGGIATAGRRTLHSHVSRLRTSLADGAAEVSLTYREPGYVLQTPAETVDALWFERRVTEGTEALEAGDADGASRLLASALGRWRGSALEDARVSRWLDDEALRLEDLRVQASMTRLEAEVVLGRHRSAVRPLEQLTADHPLDERGWELLVLALHRSGRQTDALAAFRRARRLLRRDLGMEPGPALTTLHQRILDQDPGLALSPPDPSAGSAHLGGLQVQKLEYVFRAMDLDRDGFLTAEDFARHADRLWEIAGAPADLEEAFRQSRMRWWEGVQSVSHGDQPDRAGLADWIAFWSWWLGGVAAEAAGGGRAFLDPMVAAMEFMFDLVDVDRDGRIDLSDYDAWVRAWGFDFDVKATFAMLDVDGDGFLTREETVRLAKDFYLTNDPDAPGNFLYGPAF